MAPPKKPKSISSAMEMGPPNPWAQYPHDLPSVDGVLPKPAAGPKNVVNLDKERLDRGFAKDSVNVNIPGEAYGPTDPEHIFGGMEHGPKDILPQHDAPIGPQEPVQGPPDLKPQYDSPVGPKEPAQGPPKPLWQDDPKGPVQGPNMPGEHPQAKGLITDLSKVIGKYGPSAETIAKVAPILGALTKYVLGPVGAAATVYDASQNPAAAGDEADRAKMFQSDPFRMGASGAPRDNEHPFTGGAVSVGNESPQLAPDQIASPPDNAPQAKPNSAPDWMSPPMAGEDPNRPSKQPDAIAKPTKKAAKADKPMSDEDILAWNSQNNKDFNPGLSPSGLIHTDGKVFMTGPNGTFTQIHDYGNSSSN